MTNKSKPEKIRDHSISERWTPELASHGFTPVVRPFIEDYSNLNPPLTTPEAMLVIQLISFRWDDALPFPSVPTLAKRLGCSPRHVRNMLARLEAVGYVKRNHRVGTSNLYDLSGLFNKLEQHLEVHAKSKTPKVVALPRAS